MVRGVDDDVVDAADMVVAEAEETVRPRTGGVAIFATLGAEESVGVDDFGVEGFDHDSKKSSSFSLVLEETALAEILMPSICMSFGYLRRIQS